MDIFNKKRIRELEEAYEELGKAYEDAMVLLNMVDMCSRELVYSKDLSKEAEDYFVVKLRSNLEDNEFFRKHVLFEE